MVRWNSLLASGALVSLLICSGAGVRWGELSQIISSITSLF